MSLISELETQLAATGSTVAASTVSVGRDHRGSGVVVGDGKVLTNAHNLRDRTVQVTFADGRVEQAAVSGADPAHDLVVLDVDTGDAPALEWATEPPGLGRFVVAVSLDGAGPRVSLGTVSQASRSFRGPGGRPITVALEHTAPLARGSSGGPLTDLDGRLVGVNTHRLGRGFTAAQSATDALTSIVDDLSAGRSRRPLRLGVEVAPTHVARRLRAAVGLDDRPGLLVRGVVDGGPAARAGVRVGDLLVSAGATELVVPDDLFAALSAHDGAHPMAVRLVRGAEELSLGVDFGRTPDDTDDAGSDDSAE